MAFSPITSWQIDGETVEIVADFILGGSKIKWIYLSFSPLPLASFFLPSLFFSVVSAPIKFPPTGHKNSPLQHPRQHLLFLVFLIVAF